MNNKVIMECDLGGRPLKIETGRMAKQADGSVVVHYGDTMVLVTAVSNRSVKPGQSWFPLTVDYQERYYAAGKFPGGFFKREARPSTDATLSARIIDRPIRPLFPEGYMYDTQVVATVLSVDAENDPDIAAGIGASAALAISDIPFNGPTATVRIGRVNGELVINPSLAQQEASDMSIVVAGTAKAITMVEGECEEVPENEVKEALLFAHKSMQPVIQLINDLKAKVGKPMRKYDLLPKDPALIAEMEKFAEAKLAAAFAIREKLDRYEALGKIKEELVEKFVDANAEDAEERKGLVSRGYEEVKYNFMRRSVIKTKRRIDGRDLTTIRPIACEVGVLPRVHGSSLFTRGETQVLAVVTLGTREDEQIQDDIRKPRTQQAGKKFMLHYNFPPFSVGEAGFMRGPGRREIGHGALAERSLLMMAPSKEEFPYTIRVVCETLESNGSSSMGSVCSGSMALMEAGVPLKKPVAGIAMGLIQEGNDTVILSDILGDEDHLGDMDFKVAGTKDGVTGIQMDIKIEGVTEQILDQALRQANQGRLHILGEMQKAIEAPRADLSPYAPRLYTMKVNPEKIAAIIGTGGKVIRSIIEQCDVKIDIEDDGSVAIAATDGAKAAKARGMIEAIIEEVQVGKTYHGTITRIVDFGAFVEVIPGTEGLLHVSEIAYERVQNVRDHLKEGEKIDVKVLDIDRTGKMRLSRKALLERPEGMPEEDDDRGGRGDRGHGGGGHRGGHGGHRGGHGGHRGGHRGDRDRGPRDFDRGGGGRY